MDWHIWFGWAGSALQIIIGAAQIWWTLRWHRKLSQKIDAEIIESTEQYFAVMLAFGWHWGATMERRAWLRRMTGAGNA